MSGFEPGVEAARKALGNKIPIESKPHPYGGAGVKMSLDEVARRVAKGRNDPRVRAWAIRALHKAGGPQGMLQQAEIIRAALKEATVYVQDPLNTEFMQAAHETLCLDDKGLCFKGGDCDDLTIAYASATLSVGIPTNVVGQAFNDSGIPGHVIAAVRDVNGTQWSRVDPSTDKQVGDFVSAVQEWWVDPLDPKDKTSSTIAGSGDFVGVGKLGARQGNTGLGDAPVNPTLAQTVVQQVQVALFSLTSSANNLQAALDQLDQIKQVTGYDSEPSFVITGLSDFPSNGTWTPSMDRVTKDLLSQADFLIQTAQEALSGARTIFVDPSSNDIGIGSTSSDPYSWKIVLETATDAIIGIFSPTGSLLVGITALLGEVLSPTQVQSKVAANPPGTIQGAPRGVGNPAVVAAALAAAAIVATVAVYLAYVKYLNNALALAQEATMLAMVAFADKMVSTGQWTGDQAGAWLLHQRTKLNEAQANNNADNPFGAAVDSLTSFLKWAAVGAVVVGGGILVWPFLREASQSAAAMLHAKRLAKAEK